MASDRESINLKRCSDVAKLLRNGDMISFISTELGPQPQKAIFMGKEKHTNIMYCQMIQVYQQQSNGHLVTRLSELHPVDMEKIQELQKFVPCMIMI